MKEERSRAGSNPAGEPTGRRKSHLGLRASPTHTSRSEQDGLEAQTPSRDVRPLFGGHEPPELSPAFRSHPPGAQHLRVAIATHIHAQKRLPEQKKGEFAPQLKNYS